jgi:hypothetical protein
MLTAAPAHEADPTILASPDDLNDWVATQRRILVNFVGAVEQAPLDALILALQQACKNGFGDWLVPEDLHTAHRPDHVRRPATHLVEIHVLGIQGVGLTVDEAARNWRRAALASVQTEGDA